MSSFDRPAPERTLRKPSLGEAPARDPDVGSPADWVDRHGDALFRYALARVRNRDVAEDLVQDTLLAALEAASTFRGESAFRSWLVGTLRHKLVDHFRRSRRDGIRTGDIEVDPSFAAFRSDGRWVDPPAAWDADPRELAEDRDFLAVVRRCLAGVSGRPADAFALRVLNDMPTRDVCDVLGVSQAHLSVLLHRARTKMRACLEARWFTSGGREGRE